MRFFTLLLTSALLGGAVLPAAAADGKLTEAKDRRSYSIGYQFGEDLKAKGIAIDPKLLAKGFEDATIGLGAVMTHEEMRAALTELQQELAERQRKLVAAMADANKEAGLKYLEKNGKRKEVTTTPSGLQYEVVQAGKGKVPKLTDEVTVHYRGTLVDGTEFDSSYKRGEPAIFPVNGVIKGWQEALQLMQAGAKFKIALPPELAYGERGAAPVIGPNSTLLFEVELVSVK